MRLEFLSPVSASDLNKDVTGRGLPPKALRAPGGRFSDWALLSSSLLSPTTTDDHHPRPGGPALSVRFRFQLLFFLILLVGCGSSTDPGEGDDGFDLGSAFDAEDAEFEEDATGGRFRFDDIDFGARDSSTLTSGDKAVLDGFAAVFEGLPGARYRIESHTDERGSESSNNSLTRARAEAVFEYLTDTVGGPGPYIERAGLGETEPLEGGSNQAAWDRNDRVEVVVTYPDVPVTRFVLEARRLDVVHDCDTNPEPGVLQPGDFYVTVSIRVSNRDGFFVMDEIVDRLVTANDGETLELEIAASAAIRAIEADIVEIYVEFEEWDGSGNFDFRRSQLFQFGYVPELDCWGPWEGGACGVAETGLIAVEDGSSSGPCEVSLEWTLRLENIR